MPRNRKKSADPVQEQLRSHKDEFNERTKDFISNLIDFKRAINGRGSAKANLQPSNIKDPFPSGVGSFLGTLSSQFQSLVSGASAIISEQSQYSQHRRKKQENKKDNNTNQIANAVVFNSKLIEKYGSSRLSRMVEYIKSPFSSDLKTKKRVGLLTLGADLYYDFLNLENIILSSDIDNIPEVSSHYQMALHNLEAFKIMLEKDKIEDDKKQPFSEVSDKKEQEDSKLENPANIKSDMPNQDQISAFMAKINGDLYTIISSSLPLKQEVTNLNKLIKLFRIEDNLVKKNDLFKSIEKDYENLILLVSNSLSDEKNDLKRDQLKKMVSEASYSIDSIIKISHNFATRFLKKQWLKTKSYNKSAYPRLKASKAIDIIKKLMQEILDSLEKTIDQPKIINQLTYIAKQMEEIKVSISVLNSLYRKKIYDEYNSDLNSQENENHPVMNRVWHRELQRDLRKGII